ncbi:MAG: polysaccharide biosynthesis C-terminal domain-containing protein [Flavobacteriaceae bacterium]|nr:polysaccharide biosynthesis C-terminal domain-containing protein [Flavobacteriaceae bacterium]
MQPTDYGKLELVYLTGSIMVILFGIRISNGYNRMYFYDKNDVFRKKLFATGQAFTLFCSLAFASFLFVNAKWFAAKIFDFPEGVYFIKLVTLVTLIEVLIQIPLNNLRIREKAKIFVVVSLVNLIVTTGFTIYFVAFAGKGVAGVFYAKILGSLLTVTLLFYITRNEFQLGFSFLQLKLMLGFSIFLIPSNLSALILNMSNRYFLQEYQNLEDVGLYSLGAKLAGIIPFLFTEPVKQAFGPHLFGQIDNPIECKRTLVNFTRIFFAGLSIVALSVSLFSREVVLLMADNSYAGSNNIVFILSISYLFLGLAGIIVLGIHITRKTWIITIVWLISAVASILFNIWLIPIYGRMGAATATMLSVILINVLYLYALHKVYPVKLEYFNFIKILFAMLIFNYVGTFVLFAIFPSILLKILLLAMFVVVIYFSGIIKKEELLKGRNIILKKVSNKTTIYRK